MGLQHGSHPANLLPMTEPTPRLYWSVIAFAAIATLLPVMLTAVPPLYDYAGHLARIVTTWRILTDTDPSGNFALVADIVPNLAMDGIVLAFMWLGLPAEIAGRVFLGLTLLLIGGGVLAFHRTLFARRSLFPALALPFVYGNTLLWGFMNYLFGIGVMLLAAALWERLRRVSLAAAGLWLALLAVLAFFSHLIAALLLFGVVVGLQASRLLAARRTWPAFVVALAAFLPTVALMLASPLLDKHTPTAPRTGGLFIGWTAILDRIRGFTYLGTTYSDEIEQIAVLAVLALAVYLLARRRLTLHWPMALPLAGLTVIYLVLPDGWFGTAFVPHRLPLAILGLALAMADAPGRQRALAAFVTVLMVIRIAIVLPAWQAADAAYAPFLAAIDRIPATARIYYAVVYDGPFWNQLRPPFGNLANYATIRSGAYSNGVHALPRQNLLVRSAKVADIPYDPGIYRVGSPAMLWLPPFAPSLLVAYDYVLLVNPALYPAPPPLGAELLVRTPRAVLYRLGPAGR